jgi:hypothetical protein
MPETDSPAVQRVYDALAAHGSVWGGGQDWTCPAHDDNNASLGVAEGTEVPVVMKCMAGCPNTKIMKALGLPKSLLSAPVENTSHYDYIYDDENGVPLYQVTRTDHPDGSKTFSQAPLNANGKVSKTGRGAMKGVRLVLWDLAAVRRKAKLHLNIILTEGEKGVLELEKHGKFATTAPGGAKKKWQPEWTESLRGARLVTIVADRDRAGYEHAAEVHDALVASGIPVRVVMSATTGEHDDIVDHFAAGHEWGDVVEILRPALAELVGADSPDEDAEDREAIEELKHAMRIRRQAERELAGEDFTDPGDDGSLDDQFADPAPEPEFIVGTSLIPRRGIIQVNAQWKAGKTTLVSVNLAGDLASGSPFLGEYPIKFDTGNVGIWNLEVGAGTLQRWLFARDLPPEARRRIHPQHLRGRGVNISVPVWAEWAEGWLRDHNVKVWIIDPLSKLYTGKENDATEFNAWWLALEGIAHRAEVDLVILVHHTGHGTSGEGDALPRSRGTSAMQGNPDAIYSYRHGGDLGSPPPDGDTRRYFGGFGRDVDVPEMTVEFDPTTKLLRCVLESRGRAADQTERNAMRVADVVSSAADRLNTGSLKEALAPMKTEMKVAAIRRAVAEGWITETPEGVAKWYTPGPTNHRVETVKVALGGGRDDS